MQVSGSSITPDDVNIYVVHCDHKLTTNNSHVQYAIIDKYILTQLFINRREKTQVPLIVTSCADQIEKDGIDDVGIYRVSGLSSEIQKLKKAFEKSIVF